jgi:hypothetical protein
VIRLGPKVALAQLVPLLAVIAFFAVRGSADLALAYVVGGLVGLGLNAYSRRVVLSADGLKIRWFGPSLPWSSIGAVSEFRSVFGERYLRVFDASANRTLRLPAPQAYVRIGGRELTRNRQLIERWWAANRDHPPRRAS